MRTERVPLVTPEGAEGLLREVYGEIASARGGQVGNVFRALGSSPETLRAFAQVGAHFRTEATLEPRERELLVLAVAEELACVYEWTHHLRSAASLGLSKEEVAAELHGSNDPRVQAIVTVGRAVAAGESLGDAAVSHLRDVVGDRGAVETVVMAGYYLALARVIEALAVPLEPDVPAEPFLSPY